MDSLWEPLPSDVADWMGMDAEVDPGAHPPEVRAHRRRGPLGMLADLRLRLLGKS